MKFLVDAQLPPALCRWLEQRGHQAVHVTAIGFASASDQAIADYAAEHQLMVLTKDEDFLYLRLPNRFALLWLRCGNATTRALTAWLGARWNRVEALLSAGERLIELR